MKIEMLKISVVSTLKATGNQGERWMPSILEKQRKCITTFQFWIKILFCYAKTACDHISVVVTGGLGSI